MIPTTCSESRPESSRSKKDSKSQNGYSTDADQFARSKRLLAMENKWKQIINDGIEDRWLDSILNEQIRDNLKQYESI